VLTAGYGATLRDGFGYVGRACPDRREVSGRSRKAERAAAERKRRKERAFRDETGRVHLALVRDPASGRESLALKKPLYQEQWQNDLAASAANTVLGVIEHEATLERVVELARRMMASTSRLVSGLLARAPEGSVACKAGCDHCCYQVVGVTPPEAFAIFEHLKRTRSPEELEQLEAHVARLYERARELPSAQRFSPEHPCAFLRDGSCSIYEARPLACRGVNSLDASDCETRLRDPEARARFLEQGHGGRCYLEPLRAFRAVSAGLQLGLSELYRLDMRGLDLLGAMHILLQSDATVGSAWIGGQQPFQRAVRDGQ
jgi:Fe-S-cluster containining protein